MHSLTPLAVQTPDVAPAASNMSTYPQSVSPASFKAQPMPQTAILPASAMGPVAGEAHSKAINGLNWTQLSGYSSQVAVAPDGSIWALSNQPTGSVNKNIWHYVHGTWTNISGLGASIAVGPTGTVYVVNGTSTGVDAYNGTSWTYLGGGARSVAAGADGSVYILSSTGVVNGNSAIWKYKSGTWTQQPGSGSVIQGSSDPSTYTITGVGTIVPNGYFVVNSSGLIYYYSPGAGYVQLPGKSSGVAAVPGGLFELAYPASASGEGLTYFDYGTATTSAEPGIGLHLSSGPGSSGTGTQLAEANSADLVYTTPVTTVATFTDVAAIDAGGPGTGIWTADNTDGTSLITSTTATISTSGVSSPAPQAIYQSQRYMNAGPLVYKVPGLTPGASYNVRLHYAEISATAAGQRVFNVVINGVQVATNLDIYATTGGENRALVQNFTTTADGLGQIAIMLVNVVSNPSIAGIEIQSSSTATPAPSPHPSPTPVALCIGGTSYTPTQDDEFSSDTTLNYSPSLIYATPQPSGAVWSSRAIGFSSDQSRNNIGTDDAYYTDPTRGLGTYNPFTLGNGALTITAVPVPAAYATAPQLDGAHWLSGLLESAYQTYGYVEVSAKVPNVAGQLSAPLWLLGPYGSDGLGDGYEEIDVNEMFGTEAPNNVLFETNRYTPAAAGSAQVINHTPPEVESNVNSTFHTYGVLWRPDVVRFFVDRQPTGPDFPNGAFGPMNAIISLGVFATNTWAPPPANNSPETMSLQYFRWYQTTSTSCAPSALPS